MSEHLLEVSNLKKYFSVPNGMLHAVDNVSLHIDAGQTLGVVGESGCGKSTLGKTILQLTPPSDGRILFEGEDISRVDKKRFFELRPKMQMIFQDPMSSLNPRMSVGELIAEPLKIYRSVPPREIEGRVLELMDMVGLARRYMQTYPHELDGGRRQRIGIAIALALKPRLIICDEPVSALDVLIQAQILNLLQDLQKEHNLAYMFITHDLSVVRHISHNICVMYLGHVVEKAPTRELFDRPMHPYTKALLSAILVPALNRNRERELLRGEPTSPINPPAACCFAPRCRFAREKCFCAVPTIQELAPGHEAACHFVREINEL